MSFLELMYDVFGPGGLGFGITFYLVICGINEFRECSGKARFLSQKVAMLIAYAYTAVWFYYYISTEIISIGWWPGR